MLKRWFWRKTGVCVACFLTAIFCFGCGKPAPQNTATLTPYDDLRQQVVDRIQKGAITADSAGVAALPDDLKDAAPDSHVTVAQDPALGLLVAFDLSINPSGRAEYLIYSEKDISDPTQSLSLGNLRLRVEHKSRSHWYQAIRSGA